MSAAKSVPCVQIMELYVERLERTFLEGHYVVAEHCSRELRKRITQQVTKELKMTVKGAHA